MNLKFSLGVLLLPVGIFLKVTGSFGFTAASFHSKHKILFIKKQKQKHRKSIELYHFCQVQIEFNSKSNFFWPKFSC